MTTGPTPDAAIETAEALGAMPLRARIGSAPADAPDELKLPAAALGLDGGGTPRRWSA